MGKTNNFFNKDSDQQVDSWFHQTDDESPFDAFGNSEKENKIKTEIFNQVSRKINHKALTLIFIRTAAAILLIVSVSIALFGYFPQNIATAKKQGWTTYDARSDIAKSVILADGSVVVLRAGAKLSVPETFTSDIIRMVKLDGGEAYFTVKPDLHRPFIVQSGQISTKVLGTAFNIRNIGSAKEVEIAVSHGKVQIDDQQQCLAYLTKGKFFRYNTQSHSFKLDSVDAKFVASWNSASIDLNDVSFKELAYVFNNYYGKELVVEDADVARLRYTLTISKAANAQSILKIIAKIHGLFIKEQNGKLVLYK